MLKPVLGLDLKGSMQLTLGQDAADYCASRGGTDPPMWILIFPDGRCLYRDAGGDIAPAMSLTQVMATAVGLSVEDYDAESPFDYPGLGSDEVPEDEMQ